MRDYLALIVTLRHTLNSMLQSVMGALHFKKKIFNGMKCKMWRSAACAILTLFENSVRNLITKKGFGNVFLGEQVTNGKSPQV